MCINQKLTAEQSGMRPAAAGQGMHCQGQVSGTQTARQGALAQPEYLNSKPRKIFRPLFCLGDYGLRP